MENITFKEFCETSGNEKLLSLWDYDLNDKKPEDVYIHKTNKYYMKCPRGLHGSNEVIMRYLVKGYIERGTCKSLCRKCNSFGQYIIDNFGEDYLKQIWSDLNNDDPFDISYSSPKTIWIKCVNDNTHPDYEIACNEFIKGKRCPYCSGKKVCKTNSLGYLYPESLLTWSDKNEFSPYDILPNTHNLVWWKCENNIHEDYQRSPNHSVSLGCKCPTCAYENRKLLSGEEHPNWKGGVSSENEKVRGSRRYSKWRSSVFERDGYTCQCCGIYGGELEAHHIHDFANNIEERMDIDNGITLCKKCHSLSYDDSLHSLYGTIKVGESELEEYINNKRKELGIEIPFSIDKYRNGEILTKDMINNNYEDAWDLSAGRKFVKSLNKPNNKNFIMMKPKYRIKEEC